LTVGGVGDIVAALRDDDHDDDNEIEDSTVGCEGCECGEGDDGGPLKYDDATTTDSLDRVALPPEPSAGNFVGSSSCTTSPSSSSPAAALRALLRPNYRDVGLAWMNWDEHAW
jgi:hypothetical protein